MPRYRRGFSRNRGALSLRPVNSIKNIFEFVETVGTSTQSNILAKAVSNPVNTVTNDVQNGSTIKAIWLEFDVCGLAGSGAVQRTNIYLVKNPGANLALPGAFAVGSSNEKKFVIKMWHFMTMRNQDGNPPFHVAEWVKIPRRYIRMGTDDTWNLVWESDTLTGHFTGSAIYKWFS